MKKTTIFRTMPAAILLLLIFSCNIVVISNYWGTVGAYYVDIGLTDFSFSGTGSGDTYRLTLKFYNGSGEMAEFVLTPSNTKSTDPAQMYGPTTYQIDGTDNKFSGAAMLGGGLQTFAASSGQLQLGTIYIQGSKVVSVKGNYNIMIDGGGSIDGTIDYTAAQ